MAEISKIELTRYDSLPKLVKVICFVLFILGIGLFVFFIFGWSIGGWVLEDVRYYYLLYATFTTCVFLLLPLRKKDRTRLPWYDVVFAALVFGICIYFSTKTYEIMYIGLVPPGNLDFALACIVTFLAVDGGRRMAGAPFAIVCLLIGVYPLFAEYMPGLLYGHSYSPRWLVGAFAFGREGMLGLAAKVMGTILMGFLIFAGMLIASGAGKFFLNLALALLGRFRGGAAKVAVVASGFFGSLSGSPAANVVTTGAFTIPAMKRLGYPAHYAGAIEAVASTGGVIMPPVMGAIGFVIAILADIPYAVVVTAAFIPAVLYYFGLLIQVDAYAAKAELKGLPREELPSLKKTLKEGWIFIVIFVFLVVGLIYFRWGAKAPIYASGLLVLLSFTSRETMMTPRRLIATLATTGNLVAYIMAILLPVGIILVALGVTGSLVHLTAQIVALGGVNVVAILLIAVVVCYVFGMVGSNTALIPYIVLAVTAIPTLVAVTGMNVLGLHLFLTYFLLTAGITPPVAVTAFIAAAIAGGAPMQTAWTAVRLAAVLYFIPFFFVFNPALIMQGPILETLYLFALCLLGIWFIGSGLQGYLLKVGKLEHWAPRVLLVGAGFLIALPGWQTTIIGAALAVLLIAIVLIIRKMAERKLPATYQ